MKKILSFGRNCWKKQDGSTLVEFAMVAPIFFVLVFALVELGLAVWQKNSVASDVREAARYAAVRGTTSGRTATPESVATYIKKKSSLDTGAMRVYTSWSPNKKPGSIVTVSVAHNVVRRGPFIPAHIDSASSKTVIAF